MYASSPLVSSDNKTEHSERVAADLDGLMEQEPMVKDLVDFLSNLQVGVDITQIDEVIHQKVRGIMDSPDIDKTESLQRIDRVLSIGRKLKVLSEALREDLRFVTSGDNRQVEVMEMLLQDFFKKFREWQNLYPRPMGKTGGTAQFLRGLSSSLMEMTEKLNEKSIPWISGTEVSHMTSVYQFSSLLGEIVGLFYHQTNAAREGGPATTEMEEQVIKKIGEMIGYGDDGYGYLTHGGTHANKSALIAARKVFYRPLICKMAVEKLKQEHGVEIDFPLTVNGEEKRLFSALSEDDLLKLSPDDKIEINQRLGWEAQRSGLFEDLQKAQQESEELIPALQSGLLDRIKFVVPKGINHHSIRSTIESVGFGAGNVVEVPTQKDSFQVDYDLLEQTLDQLNQDGKIVIGYLDVIGSTGFGSMTNTRKILDIRKNCEKKNFSFNIHIDGAYGGPLVAMFRNADGSMMSLEEAWEKYVTVEQGFSPELLAELYETFSHLAEVDSVTIDLHKSIFGVYTGGGGSILWKNKAVKEIISKFPPYYGDRENGEPYAFSRLEGCTFPGSAAAAAHLSIENVGLDNTGIGKYHAESIKSCNRVYDSLKGLEMPGRNGEIFQVEILNQPQIHIMNFRILPRDASRREDNFVNQISQTLVTFMRNNEDAGRSFGLSLNEVNGKKYVRVTTMNPFALQGGLLEEFINKLKACIALGSFEINQDESA